MWSLIRWGLLATNFFFLVMGTAELWHDLTRPRGPDRWDLTLAFVVLALAFNLWFLAFRTNKGRDWLSLWMTRKRLEEEKRIKELEGQS